MASHVYPKGAKAFLDKDIDLLVDTIVLLYYDTNDGAYDATDQFISDLPGAGIVGRSGALTSPTTTGGVFDAANFTETAVTSGDQFEAVIVAADLGADSASPLIAFLELGTPFTPPGGDFSVVFNASGIFSIGG